MNKELVIFALILGIVYIIFDDLWGSKKLSRFVKDNINIDIGLKNPKVTDFKESVVGGVFEEGTKNLFPQSS